jgi:hypothetical protein
MVKCFKLPEIQVCIAFEGFLPGDLRGKNRVVSRYKNSIFTIDKIVKLPGRNTKIKKFTAGRGMWTTGRFQKWGQKTTGGQAFQVVWERN